MTYLPAESHDSPAPHLGDLEAPLFGLPLGSPDLHDELPVANDDLSRGGCHGIVTDAGLKVKVAILG